MKKSFWFKIITIIIIQAILLTQVEFALASTFSSKDLCREAALKYQKITSRTISLIFGIGCLQLNSRSRQLDKLFSLLTSDSFKLAENVLASKSHNTSKDIYKVFALTVFNCNTVNNQYVALIINKAQAAVCWMSGTQESRGPPMITKNIESNFNSRIV
ncbi:MAG: hypothetical protein KJ915_00405 [Candidatus Omnitrophica bacterium]|nr:hypothetical protein [Candidatus Omnitrophota bacterium]